MTNKSDDSIQIPVAPSLPSPLSIPTKVSVPNFPDGNTVEATFDAASNGLVVHLSDIGLRSEPYELRIQNDNKPLNGTVYLCPADVADCAAYNPKRDVCSEICQEDEECCIDSDTEQSECRNVTEDESNCGGCGHTCEWDETCLEGVCARVTGPTCWNVDCPDQMSCCSTGWFWGKRSCKALLSDNNNCGWCGLKCPSNTSCVNGLCLPKHEVPCDKSCASDKSCCYLYGMKWCTDLKNDSHHCGSCGKSCECGEVCDEGECKPWYNMTEPCSSGEINCGIDGVDCVALSSDRNNCGACGIGCTPDAECIDGHCIATTKAMDGTVDREL